jgi:hypothetical protein
VHSTNNYTKYFTVVANNARSRNMNVAIINDESFHFSPYNVQ